MPEPRLFDAGDPAAAHLEEARTPSGTVVVRHTRDHPFQKKAPPAGSDKPSPGCAVCNAAKRDMRHVGAPQSINALGSPSTSNRHVYQGWKKGWSETLGALLEQAGVPRPLAHVEAEGLVCFPTRAARDQGNFRVIIEKALGDTLVEGGWLPDDNWDFYEFGALRRTYSRGEAWTELTLGVTLPPVPDRTEATT